MDNKGGKIYAEEEPFAQVSNAALRDNTLSLKAKGLYALIKSYITLKDFTLYKNTLKKECLEKEKAFESTWKELKDHGYLIQYRFQNDKGQYYYEYKLLSLSNLELASEVHDQQNRKNKYEKNHTPKKGGMEKTKKVHTPKKEGMEKINENHTPKKDNMDKGYNGLGGVYNNTYPNNTNLNNTDTCSSSNLFDEFQDNICELKKTTTVKFEKLTKGHDVEMVLAIIDECTNSNVKSYKGFEVAFNSYLERGCKAKEDVIKAATEYRLKNKKGKLNKPYKSTQKTKNLKSNTFKPREYDYDSLEKRLLGWEQR